ncbi:DNA polymerase III subunit chi [Thiotrichales bacterium 19S11-10]|nr:DNA polymerase III subunit chi [Thiotrichales bacterium 19S11-10]
MKVDFYILSTNTSEERLKFCCRLVEKAMKNHQKLIILCQDETMLNTLDEMLWHFKPESFIPHLQFAEALEENLIDAMPVILTDNKKTLVNEHSLLIKLHNDCLSNDWSQEDLRVIEIVDQDKTVLESSRESFKDYKKRNFKLQVHKLN